MPHCQGAAQGSSHKRVIAGSDAPCSCVKWSSIPPWSLSAPGHRSLHVFSVHGRHFLLLFKSLSLQSLSPAQFPRASSFSAVVCSSPHCEKVWVGSPCPLEVWSPKPLPPCSFCSGEMKSPSWTRRQSCRGKGCSGLTHASHAAKKQEAPLCTEKSFWLVFVHYQWELTFLYCNYRSPGLGILL